MKHRFGLIGKRLDYSFSRRYFTDKFQKQALDAHCYENIELSDITEFSSFKNENNYSGFNVTIPYKQTIIPHLDEVDASAAAIGAVNTIVRTETGKLKGYNTDTIGFMQSLREQTENLPQRALLIGSGGASSALSYALEQEGVVVVTLSRKRNNKKSLTYNQLTAEAFKTYDLVVNCTPLGTLPDVTNYPLLPYHAAHDKQLFFDLTYNPDNTQFMKLAASKGAKTVNGYDMLVYQAEAAWLLWNQQA